MNARSKVVHLGSNLISINQINKYVELNNIVPVSVKINSLLGTNILKHWCEVSIAEGNRILYDRFTIKELAKALSNIEDVDISVPIIMIDGELLDGVHRVLKCKLAGIETINAYKLETKDFVNILNKKYKK